MTIELIWIAIYGTAFSVTLAALLDAVRDQRTIRRTNGAARTLVVRANVRRESVRLGFQMCFLLAVVPGLLAGRVAAFSPAVLLLMLGALLILANSLFDWRDRRRLSAIADDAILAERFAALDKRVTAGEGRMTGEMKRTDVHQGVQDTRMDATDARLDERP
jgi:hypothetical protein